MPVELHLSSERQADPSLPSDVQAFASSLAGFIERTSARYQGTHHLRPDPPRVHEPRLRGGTSAKPTDVQQDAPSAGAADTAQTETAADAGAVAEDLGGSDAQVLEPPPRPRWGSRAINKILERRRLAEEGRGTLWCRALPHDAVPGPLVAALLDEWLPARAVAATDAQVFAAADRLEVLRPTAAAMNCIGQQKGATHADSLTIKMAGTELTYDTLRAAAARLPQVTSLTVTDTNTLPDKLGKHLCAFPCLTTLIFEECVVADRHFLDIWRCEKLESVRLDISGNPCSSATSHVAVQRLARCPALTTLHNELFNSATSVEDVFRPLAQLPLTSLGLNFRRVPFFDPTVGSAFMQFTVLQSLSLEGGHFMDAFVPYLVHCRVLESIRFIDAHGLTPIGLAQLFELPALTNLGLIGLTLRICIFDDTFGVMGDSTPSLRALDVSQSYATDGGIRAVLRRCPAVKHITAKQCRLLSGSIKEEARAQGVTLTLY